MRKNPPIGLSDFYKTINFSRIFIKIVSLITFIIILIQETIFIFPFVRLIDT
jgi:hypothetical protein